MSTSHYARRTDGADTIQPAFLTDPNRPENTRLRTRLHAACWMLAGVCLLLTDGIALAHFCDTMPEALVFAFLTMPTGFFVIACALEARK